MTPEERAALRALAEVVPMPDTDPDILERWYQDADLVCHPVSRVADRAFIAAVSPDVVLSLLDTLDAREVEIALFSAALDQAAEDRDDLTAAIERVRALAEEWRYKGEHGHGPWQAGSGPSPDGEALDWASSLILRALDGGE